jgi:hypothetical protein
VPSARQQAAPSSVPSASKATAFIPPATEGTATTRWPRAATSSRIVAGMSCSISSSWPWLQIRGASTASCSVMPWSIRLTTAWNTDVKMRTPPGRPSAHAGLPSRSTMVGAMLLVTRLPGAMEAGFPGCGSKSAMVLFKITPVPGTVAFDPNRLLRVWVIATTFPSESAVVTCVVWPEPAATPGTAA